MRVLLLYFSGTGHTGIYANAIANAFRRRDHEVVCYRYSSATPFKEDINSFDMVGVGYPIHAFNVPSTFNRFLKDLPEAKKPLFIFKVSGEPYHLNDASSHHSVKSLQKKGFSLVGEKHFLMPYNIIFRYPDALAKQMMLYVEPLSELFAKELVEGRGERIRYTFPKKLLSFLLRIEWIAPKVNGPLVKVNKKKCTHCHLCVKTCLTQAIVEKENGKLSFSGKKCVMCMHCTHFCPVNAIRFGIMNPWKVNGPYPYKKLLEDPNVDPCFIHEGMKGYFKLFLPYFRKQEALLKEEGIASPMPPQDK